MARQVSSRRGFASMDKEKQRAIASKGGKAAHAKGTAHEFTPAEAREAGRKGGEAGAVTRGQNAAQSRETSASSDRSGARQAARPRTKAMREGDAEDKSS